MRFTLLVAQLASFAAVCNAAPTPTPYTIHEKRSGSPRKWSRGERVERDSILPVRIGLTQNNLDDGYHHLMDVSHPDSPNFGKHWSKEEVADKFAPTAEAVQAVYDWLVNSGVEASTIVHSENKGWLAIDMPAWQAEEAFQAEYYEHVHATGNVRVGCDEYSLPDSVKVHINYITPGIKLTPTLNKKVVKRTGSTKYGSPPGPMKWLPPHEPGKWTPPAEASTLPADLQDCGRNITPPCLKALYDIPNATRKDSVNMLGLFESGDIYSQDDLNSFFAEYAPNVPQGTHPKLDSIDGGEAPVAFDSDFNTGESDIDMDIGFSLIYPQTITLYQVDDNIEAFTDGGFNTFLDALDGSYCTYSAYGITGDTPGFDAEYPDPASGGYKGNLMCGTYTPTRVISVSYGLSEYDAPVDYTKRQCNEFMKLGLQGHTFLWASGDYGVASFPGDDNDNGCLGDTGDIYNPSFATCPYITSVGATRLYDTQTVKDPESAMQADLGEGAELFASTGGFANYFPAPDYQKSALATYFAEHDPGLPYYTANTNATNVGANGGVYNRAGRGLPDVSANGAAFRAYNNQVDYHWYGTSLSAPIWGSIITLINEERTAVGKGPVGFINPALYANPMVFNDIVNGSNPGCNGPGFKAVSGWDPVTGLGTPKYPSLLKLFLSLP
ncbi:Pro-kumamolisin, activation domain-containing protein [Calycina marina]|uniref:Pro-kumamolisin, activation domain-containing protein n=1 Tax=Calycina marina TaxID=1763456 RepID=A0A9P7YUV4_9HELO|nr:Pro-kumamolisin, activation domain-containing protein [Calycina marina]